MLSGYQQFHALAPVLNSPSVDNLVTVNTSDAEVPVKVLVKRHQGASYSCSSDGKPWNSAIFSPDE
jgi:hypothetical protein